MGLIVNFGCHQAKIGALMELQLPKSCNEHENSINHRIAISLLTLAGLGFPPLLSPLQRFLLSFHHQPLSPWAHPMNYSCAHTRTHLIEHTKAQDVGQQWDTVLWLDPPILVQANHPRMPDPHTRPPSCWPHNMCTCVKSKS